jgi:hypothetical protein
MPADVVVISRTKSGRTWLRAMPSHLCQLRCGVPVDRLVAERLEPADGYRSHGPAAPMACAQVSEAQRP